MKPWLHVIIFACILLVSCGQAALPAATLPIVTNTVPAPVGTATATVSPIPSATPEPSQTNSPVPTQEVANDAAQQPLAQDPNAPDVLNGLDTAAAWGASPDQSWYWSFGRAVAVRPPPEVSNAGTVLYPLVLRSADGSKEWQVTLAKEDIYDHWYIDIYYVPIQWLPSEPYVFLIGGAYPPDEPVYFGGGLDLVRLDLRNGKVSKQVTGWTRHYYKFSPDGAYYLDAPRGSNQLRFHFLVDGHETLIDLPETWKQNGNASISDDHKQVAVQSCDVDPETFDCKRSPLILINLETGEYSVLLSDLIQPLGQAGLFYPKITWLDEGHLSLLTGGGAQPELEWVLDIATNRLKQTKGN